MTMTAAMALKLIVVLWAFFYTISYGVWSWKNKYRLGAIAIYFLALSVLGVTIFTMIKNR